MKKNVKYKDLDVNNYTQIVRNKTTGGIFYVREIGETIIHSHKYIKLVRLSTRIDYDLTNFYIMVEDFNNSNYELLLEVKR